LEGGLSLVVAVLPEDAVWHEQEVRDVDSRLAVMLLKSSRAKFMVSVCPHRLQDAWTMEPMKEISAHGVKLPPNFQAA
jgi:hypothetical protein